jgi:hypothetical protein
MNYLKSITSTVLTSAGVSYPFTIGERIPGQEPGSSIWELREGVKRVCMTMAGRLSLWAGRWYAVDSVHL